MLTPGRLRRWAVWPGAAFTTCMLTAVDKGKKGKGRIVNERFATMCAHYLVDPDFCNVASGWEKGVVEKNVQDSRRHGPVGASSRPVDRRGQGQIRQLHRTQRLACGSVPSLVAGGPPPRTPAVPNTSVPT